MSSRSSNSKLFIWISLIGLSIVVLVVVLTRSETTRPPAQAGSNGNGYPEPGAGLERPPISTSASLLPEVQQILAYREALEKENLSSEMRQGLQTKIEILSRVATQRAIAKEVTFIPQPRTPLSDSIPTLPSGLREGGSSDFHTWEAVIQNIWSQYVNNGEHVTVYAGELGSGTDFPGRGVVYVLRRTPDRNSRSFNEYLLPEGTGWVRISEVKGDILVLTSKEGETFFFNVPAQQLVFSLADTMPTVTPLLTVFPRSTATSPSHVRVSATPYP